MDEVLVDDHLIVIYLVAGDNQAEGFDETLAVRAVIVATHVEVGCATCHVLAADGVVSDALVEGLAAVTTGDDHRQIELHTKWLKRVLAEAAQVGLGLRRRDVLDAVLLSRGALDELVLSEVRRVHDVIVHCCTFLLLRHLFYIHENLLQPLPGMRFPLVFDGKNISAIPEQKGRNLSATFFLLPD